MKKTYLQLAIEFRELNHIQRFDKMEMLLYYHLLSVFYEIDREKICRTNHQLINELNISSSSLKKAREGLSARGLLYFRKEQGYKGITYRLTPFKEA